MKGARERTHGPRDQGKAIQRGWRFRPRRQEHDAGGLDFANRNLVGPEGFEPSTNGLKVGSEQFATVHNRSLPSLYRRCLFALVRADSRQFSPLGIKMGISPALWADRSYGALSITRLSKLVSQPLELL